MKVRLLLLNLYLRIREYRYVVKSGLLHQFATFQVVTIESFFARRITLLVEIDILFVFLENYDVVAGSDVPPLIIMPIRIQKKIAIYLFPVTCVFGCGIQDPLQRFEAAEFVSLVEHSQIFVFIILQ